jgi:hypothetical protein
MICFCKSSLLIATSVLLTVTGFMVPAASGATSVLAHEKSATLSHPFVGMLLKGDSGASYWPHCTVTLVSPDHVLTARHCVKYLHGHDLKVFFPFEGFGDISKDGILEFCEKSDNHCSNRIDDLVLIRLATPYTTLPTAQLGNLADLNSSNEKTIVGFGLDDGTLPDNGIKREGRIVLNRCNKCASADIETSIPSIDHRSLCFSFGEKRTNPIGVSSIGNQHGDSGGPMLNTGVGSHPVVGVAREADWACSERNQKEGQYVNLTHSDYNDWLSDAFCGPSREARSKEHVNKLLEINLARLDHEDTQDNYQIDIQPGVQKLIVTMNHAVGGWDPDPNDLDVLLDMNAECTRYIGVEVCIVNKPASGSHTVSVKRIHKSAAYQLAAIAIYTAHSTPREKTPATGGK